jgi:hypothetical protein
LVGISNHLFLFYLALRTALLEILHDHLEDLEDKVLTRYDKVVEDLKSWGSELLKLGLSEAEKSNVSNQLDVATQAAIKLFEARSHELRGNSYSFKGCCTVFLEGIIERAKRSWLNSVFQIMEALPIKRGKLSSSIITQGYWIMEMLLKDVIKLQLLSRKNLTYFLNNNKNAQIILSHTFKRLDNHYISHGFLYPNTITEESDLLRRE